MVTMRKPAAKSAARRTGAKKPATRKPAAKKPASKRPLAKRLPAKNPAARKRAARKPAVGKSASPGVLRRASGEALRLAGVGTDAVAKATGKTWDQWLVLLDKAGVLRMPHKEIAAMLANRYGVSPWWSQMVTVGYEQARGLRDAHRKSDGYSASASRTMAASVGRLYGAWEDPKLRELWLGQAPIAVKRATDGKSMRMTWTAGGSSVQVNFYPASDGRSRVQVQHDRLDDAKARTMQKSFWSDALDRLKAMLEKAA